MFSYDYVKVECLCQSCSRRFLQETLKRLRQTACIQKYVWGTTWTRLDSGSRVQETSLGVGIYAFWIFHRRTIFFFFFRAKTWFTFTDFRVLDVFHELMSLFRFIYLLIFCLYFFMAYPSQQTDLFLSKEPYLEFFNVILSGLSHLSALRYLPNVVARG